VSTFITIDGNIVYSHTNTGVTEKGPLLRRHVLKEAFVGNTSKPIAGEHAPTNVSIYRGSDKSKWLPHIPTFGTVLLEEVFPGIDARFAAVNGIVEKIFTVSPGANPASIRMRLDGQKSLAVDDNGELVVYLDDGEVSFSAPVAWQTGNGEKSPLQVSWKLLGKNEYGFDIDEYDRSRPLVIDPVFQTTYLGGSGDELEQGMHIAANNKVYVWGGTDSVDFPNVTGGAQALYGGNATHYGGTIAVGDIFIARLNDDLTTLEQATYIGGTADETIAIPFESAFLSAADGSVYLTGRTTSADFPVTAGSLQGSTTDPVSTDSGGIDYTQGDGFIVHLSEDLSTLLHATYLGGSASDTLYQLAFDSTGNLYAVGMTGSGDFPGTAGGAQSVHTGGYVPDTVIALVNTDLSSLLQSTYFGGSFGEWGGLVIDPGYGPAGDGTGIYLYGQTKSTDLPGTSGGAQPNDGGGTVDPYLGRPEDFFVAKFSNDLTSLIQATYLGGSGAEGEFNFGNVGALISGTSVYVYGSTPSTDYPGVASGIHTTGPGGVISRLTGDLATLVQSTYYGSSVDDVVANTSGDLYTCGTTSQNTLPGPPGGANETGIAGLPFVSRISGSLQSVVQATYLGLSESNCGYLALANDGSVYVSSLAADDQYGILPLSGGVQPVHAGNGDALITRLTGDLTTFLQSTYLGGSGREQAYLYSDPGGHLVSLNGGVYVHGYTTSSDLPGTLGAAQPAYGGDSGGFGIGLGIGDAFVSVLNEDLTDTAPTMPVSISGTIKTAGGIPICAMVLASGQYMFSCNPVGDFALYNLPREPDGRVKLQIYADGFRPYIIYVNQSSTLNIVMTAAGACPNYNAPYTPAVNPGSTGKRVNISGQILLQNTTTPVCAMVLANGQHMFSCGGSGNYALNIPLDANGQFKLQVYAHGFAPYTIRYDEYQLVNTVRLARATECQ
jgi:hypothetical protein